MSWCIVVVASGWILVGQLEDHHSEAVVLRRAAVVRYWGTDRGVGQLAAGPRAETKCDPVGRVTLVRTNVLMVLDASEDGAAAWSAAADAGYPIGGSRARR